MEGTLTQPLLGESDHMEIDEEAQIYERRHSSVVTTILLCALFGITAAIFVVFPMIDSHLSSGMKELIYSVAALTGTSLISGATCWFALKLILRPCCHSRQANEIYELVETLFTHYIFSSQVIEQFMSEETAGLTCRHSIERYATQIMDSSEFTQLIDEALDNFFRSADGSAFEALWLSKGTIRPFACNAVRAVVLQHCVGFVTEILALPPLSPDGLSSAARDYLLKRCEEMDPYVVSDAMEQVIGSNATLVVCWGVAAGALLSIVSRTAIYFWRG
jgi:hypothetical protein